MARGSRNDEEFKELPGSVTDYVGRVIRMIGYRRKVRREVKRELLGHFTDALGDCPSPEETQAKAEQLIAEFGNPQLLATLCRRAKKRGRPLWLRAIGGTRMAIFILLTAFSSYAALFICGKPIVTDEYLLRLNRLGRPQLPVPDNARPHYEKAASLFVEPDEELREMSAFRSHSAHKFRGFAALSDSQREDLVGWVTANEPAWNHYEMASCRSRFHCQWRYDRTLPSVPLLMDITMNPWLVRLRQVAEIGVWKARLAAEEGHLDEAIDDCLVVARAGTHWQMSAVLIDQLVGVGLGGAARSELLRIVAKHGLPEGTLRDVQTGLISLYPEEVPFVNFAGERLVVLDAVQHTFTKGGFGGGHMIPGQFMGSVSDALELPEGRRTTIFKRVLLWPMDVGLSMIHARRDKTVAKVHEVYDEIHGRSRLSPHQRRVRNIGGWQEIADSMSMYRYGLVSMLLPSEDRISELAFQLRADHEATLTVLALKRYYADRGAYPLDLERLVDAGYLRSIPMDPFSDGPLIYKRVGDEFLLYSVGRDFVDGGGERGVDDEGQPRIWAENGDRVFWPFGGAVE